MTHELEPSMSEEELKSHISAKADEIASREDVNEISTREEFADFFHMLKQTEFATTPYPVSCEKHLSDDLISDWDLLSQFDATEPIELLAAKSNLKYQSAIKNALEKQLFN